jgi:hypothetical protein
MKESSVNAVLACAIILLLPGTAIISPDGRLFCLVLSAVMSGVALWAGKKRGKRIWALIILLVAFGLVIPTFSEYRIHYDRYKNRVMGSDLLISIRKMSKNWPYSTVS